MTRMKRIAAGIVGLFALIQQGLAGEIKVTPMAVSDYKSVFGQVESRDVVPARARIGGTIVSLAVDEGSAVKAGDVIATVVDDKLALQLEALDARIAALGAELANALTELDRGKKLLAQGVVPKSRVDTLQTQYDVLNRQVEAAKAERSVLVQQSTEGQVIAPAPGRVLTVPVTKGSVIMPGETVARIAGGGYFLRLSLPERHAAMIREGDVVRVGARGMGDQSANGAREGKLVKVYPELDGGHVIADVEVDGLGDFFVGERTLVWVPVETREVISVPAAAVSNRHGVDYVTVKGADGPLDVAVIVGGITPGENGPQVEILSGLSAGDTVITP
ncbi:efflux RND transporter periplasmic adaptor subunit [Aestuariivirga sp.]|uniref:efflux RND transporter periplasmic adaptor subunit n=1 Tax=Aestuariivirga sp. TaxID=2650926 RepID=UPI0039E5454E